MNNTQIRPPLPTKDSATMLAQLQQTNPQMFARIQAMRPDLLETANEHLLSAVLAAANAGGHGGGGGHGHSHTHSSSCSHAQSPIHFSRPSRQSTSIPEPSK